MPSIEVSLHPIVFTKVIRGRLFIEAVTVNPTIQNGINVESRPPKDKAGHQRYLEEKPPIKFGRALYSKWKCRYWELPYVAGNPIVLAIQDFHFPHFIVWSEPSVAPCLYGKRSASKHDETGTRVIEPKTATQHSWKDKVILRLLLPAGGGAYQRGAHEFTRHGTVMVERIK
jgi:hypothetical protein